MKIVRHASFVLLLILSTASYSLADAIDDAFSEWKTTVEASAKLLREKQVLTFDRAKGLLKIEKELQINENRVNTMMQSVQVSALNAEVELEGPSKLPEPWVKLRCKGNKKSVKSEYHVVIDREQVQEVSKDGDKAFFVISCHRSDLKKAKEQGEAFLALVTSPAASAK